MNVGSTGAEILKGVSPMAQEENSQFYILGLWAQNIESIQNKY